MGRRISLILSLTLFFVIAAACPISSAQIIEIGEKCPYPTIQAGIDAAEPGDTIHIQPGVYKITKSIHAKSNITIQGADPEKTIIFTESFSDCSSHADPGMIYLHNVKNVTIQNITFLGPADSLANQHNHGGTSEIGGLREARNGIMIKNSKNIKITNCKFSMLLSDGVRVEHSQNLNIRNSIFDCAGHDSISLFKSENAIIENCRFNLMINTCIRIYNSESVQIQNNIFTQALPGTGAGYIEFEGTVTNVRITSNIFLPSYDPVIFCVIPAGGSAQITDNILCGVAPIGKYPYTITKHNNTIHPASDAEKFTRHLVPAPTPAPFLPMHVAIRAKTPEPAPARSEQTTIATPAGNKEVPGLSLEESRTYHELIAESEHYRELGETMIHSANFKEREIGYQYIRLSKSKYATAERFKYTQRAA